MLDKWAIIQEIIKHKGWSAIFSAMATGLRDEIKTMRGRRQEAGRALNDRHWSMDLSPFRGQEQEGEAGTGGQWERGEGGKGQAALGFHRCTNSGNCLSSKRRSFSSQGSNWTCQTVHLHGNDYLLLCEPGAFASVPANSYSALTQSDGCRVKSRHRIIPTWPIILLFLKMVSNLTNLGAIQTHRRTVALWKHKHFLVSMHTVSVSLPT